MSLGVRRIIQSIDADIKCVFDGVGHFGTFSGSAFRERIAPSIAEFIQKHK